MSSGRLMKDISGQKFGRLTAIEPTEERRNGSVCWFCKCDCGNEFIAKCSSLIKGETSSCGCLKKESVSKNIRKAHIKRKSSRMEENFLKWYDELDKDTRSIL